jgi:thioredoxin 1
MMKKIAFLLCTVLLAVVLQGACGNDDKKNSSNTTTKEEKKPVNFKVTFVELGSVRCIPCKKMQPIMEEIKKEYEGQVKVVFHDVWTEEGRPFAYQFRIRVIPTQVFLDKDGNEYFRHEGFFPKEELVKILKQKGVK